MFHEHETVDLRARTTSEPEPARPRARRAAVELGLVTAVLYAAALGWHDESHEAWHDHEHVWLVPLLVVAAYAGNRVRARLGRTRGTRTVVFDASGIAVIGAALLLPPVLFPLVALASSWRRDLRRTAINTAVRLAAMSASVLAFQAATARTADAGLPDDTVRVAGLLAAGAAYLLVEVVAHLRHLDLADALGDELEGVAPELVLRDSPAVALGLLMVALLAVSPVTVLLLVPLVALVVRSLLAQEELLAAGADGKTGLLSLDSFTGVADAELSRARRHGRPLVAVMFDLDHMKSVNRSHGHLAGDRVLRSMGELLRLVTRREDVVARFGGDEFCLLLPDTDLDGGTAIVERLRGTVAGSVLLDDGPEPVRRTASFGVTRLRVDDDVTSLLLRADSALREAKTTGRDRVVVLE